MDESNKYKNVHVVTLQCCSPQRVNEQELKVYVSQTNSLSQKLPDNYLVQHVGGNHTLSPHPRVTLHVQTLVSQHSCIKVALEVSVCVQCEVFSPTDVLHC